MFRLIIIVFLAISYHFLSAQVLDTLVDIGSHRLHFKVIQGKGMPILFEAGNGDDATVWQSLIKEIHAKNDATLISYDRAGLGSSGLDTNAISMQEEIKNLRKGLKKLGYREPVMLVSHSFGANYATLYANRFSRKVKGIIFIDPALPCFMTPEWSRAFIENISKENWQMIKKYKRGLYHILQRLPENMAYVKQKSIGDKIPLTVIAADNPPNMVQPTDLVQWRACLKDFGEQPNGNHILVKGSSHKIWETHLQIVAEQIMKLYAKIN